MRWKLRLKLYRPSWFNWLSDKMKDTFTGRLSTLKDNINKSLAELIGVGNDGAVKAGSIFDKFCKE